MTRRTQRQPDAVARLEARTVTVTVALGAGAQIEASAVPVPEVGHVVRWAVALRRALVAEGLDELVPHDVTTVPADRVEVPEDEADDEARVRPSDAARPRVGFA